MSTAPIAKSPAVRIAEPLFYVPDLAADASHVVLTDEEARHVGVQRLRVRDAIALFDGRGRVARGHIQTIGRNRVEVHVAQWNDEPAPSPHIDLYSAVPKGDRMAVLLDMATQLGMSRFIPVRWQRSIAEPGSRAYERWRRICIESCKQSRRLHVPEIAESVTVETAMSTGKSGRMPLLVAHPYGDTQPVLSLGLAGVEHLALFIGPEGGLTDDEANALRAEGGQFVQLGPAILRIETAAVALISLTTAAARIT